MCYSIWFNCWLEGLLIITNIPIARNLYSTASEHAQSVVKSSRRFKSTVICLPSLDFPDMFVQDDSNIPVQRDSKETVETSCNEGHVNKEK